MNKTVNQGISRRNFFTGAAAATLTAIAGCNDEKEVTQFQTGTGPEMYDVLNFYNQEDFQNVVPIIRRKNEVCVCDDGIEGRLHFYEAKDSPTGPQNLIKMNDAFVVGNRAGPCNTHILRYTGHDPVQMLLTFKDYATGTREVMYDNTNTGTLVTGGVSYPVKLDPATGNLAVDLTGDWQFTGKQAFIVDQNFKVTLEEDLLLK